MAKENNTSNEAKNDAKNNEAKEKKDVSKDIFVALETFPEPSFVFKFHSKSLIDIKQECIVVLDTNVLLLLYSAKAESLPKVGIVYKKLIKEKRLFIPAQVAREFSKNRANKIVEMFQYLTQKHNTITGMNIQIDEYHLLDAMPEYQEMMELKSEITSQIQKLSKIMKNVIDVIEGWNWDDPLSLIYSELGFSELVFEPEFDIDETKKTFGKRFLHEIPPGYKDGWKLDDGIGDYLIWKTILQLGKEKKKSVIFITGDEKLDWRHKTEKVALYPRYELVDEFRRASDGNTFHLVKFSEFLDLFEVDKILVDEMKRLEEAAANTESTTLLITESEFLNKLKEFKYQTHDNYIGQRKFLDYLGWEHNYNIIQSYSTLTTLVEKGLIRIYDVETSKGILAKAIEENNQ